MGCVWCEGDTELHEDLFNVLTGDVDNEQPDKLRRALQDLYHCLNCINSYHKLKFIHIKNEAEFQHLWKEVECLKINDQLEKSLHLADKEDCLPLPILEILQFPYIFANTFIIQVLTKLIETVLCGLSNSSKNFFLDGDMDYPGLFLLLVSGSEKVRKWSSQWIKEMPSIQGEHIHKYLDATNCLLYLITYQHEDRRNEEDAEPGYPELLPTKLPFILYSTNTEVLFAAYNEIFKLIPSRLLRISLSNENNKDFFTHIVQRMKDSEELFWSGVGLLGLLLQQLDSSFWLLSNAFSAPDQLYFMIKSNNSYLHAEQLAKQQDFKESKSSETEELFIQFTTQSEEFFTIFSNVMKSSNHRFQFSWMLPLLKTLTELDNYFGSTVKTIMDCLLQTIDESRPTSDLYISAISCFMCIIQFLSDISQLELLNEISNQVIDTLITVSTLNLHYTDVYKRLKKSTQCLVSFLITKSIGQKLISSRENLTFRSNWMKMISNQDYNVDIVNQTLHKLFKKSVVVKTEETDDKRAIQEQINLKQTLDSAEVILIESDEDEDLSKNEVIQISDSDDSDDETEEVGQQQYEEEGDQMLVQDVKGYFPLIFAGSLSPIRISDDDEPEISDNDSANSARYNEDFHGEYHFSIDNAPLEENEVEETEELTVDVVQPPEERIKESRKPSFSISNLKAKLGSGLNKEALIKNKEKSKKKAFEGLGLSGASNIQETQKDTNQNKDNSIYENQIFDITSNFHAPQNQEVQPPKKKRLTIRAPTNKELRRERLEKELCSPTSLVPPTKGRGFSSKPKNPIPVPTPSLPETITKHRYTMDLFHNSVLTWDPAWLEQGRDELEISTKLNAVPFSYNSFDEYMKITWPLMMLETWAQLRRDWDDCKDTTVRKAYQIESFEEKANVKISLIRCSYIEPVTKNQPMHAKDLFEQDLVFLSFNDGQLKLFGIIDSLERGFNKNRNLQVYTLHIITRNVAANKCFKSVMLARITTLTTVLRQWNGLINFQNSLLCKDILKPFRPQTFPTSREKLIARTDRLLKLNHDQFQAVSSATRAVMGPFAIPRVCLLQGPPGTGKSYTVKTIITHIVQEFGKEKQSKKNESEKTVKSYLNRNRILVCAPSNAAVDEIVKRLLNSPPLLPANPNAETNTQQSPKNCGDFNLIRVGRQVEPALRHCTLEYLVDSKMRNVKFRHNPDAIRKEIKRLTQTLEELDRTCVKLKMSADPKKKVEEYRLKMKEREKYQQKYDDLIKSLDVAKAKVDMYVERKRYIQTLLRHADIICCTLSGAGSEWMIKTFKKEDFRKHVPFNCVLVDEAGQCTEPDVLIPLQYGTSKLVLVGDQNQLPATVLSQKASRYNFGQSLFERIILSLDQYRSQCTDISRGERAAGMLTTQYRMTKEICSFPSKRFYENKLRPAKQLSIEKPWPLRPYIVISIEGNERKTAAGSLHNPLEREYVLALCKAIVDKTSIKQAAIGIITPYRQQAKMVRENLSKNDLGSVAVNTIDGYQGQEKEVVILSCVRGPNQKNTIGFLSHPQRMNVALTRAKKTLVVLANHSVKVDDDWKELFKDAQERDLLFDIDSTKEAVKCLLREYSSKDIQQHQSPPSSSNTHSRREQRGTLFLENAPAPSRPSDPRRAFSKVGDYSYLALENALPASQPVDEIDTGSFVTSFILPSINEDDKKESSNNSSENNNTTSVRYLAESIPQDEVLDVTVVSKQQHINENVKHCNDKDIFLRNQDPKKCIDNSQDVEDSASSVAAYLQEFDYLVQEKFQESDITDAFDSQEKVKHVDIRFIPESVISKVAVDADFQQIKENCHKNIYENISEDEEDELECMNRRNENFDYSPSVNADKVRQYKDISDNDSTYNGNYVNETIFEDISDQDIDVRTDKNGNVYEDISECEEDQSIKKDKKCKKTKKEKVQRLILRLKKVDVKRSLKKKVGTDKDPKQDLPIAMLDSTQTTASQDENSTEIRTQDPRKKRRKIEKTDHPSPAGPVEWVSSLVHMRIQASAIAVEDSSSSRIVDQKSVGLSRELPTKKQQLPVARKSVKLSNEMSTKASSAPIESDGLISSTVQKIKVDKKKTPLSASNTSTKVHQLKVEKNKILQPAETLGKPCSAPIETDGAISTKVKRVEHDQKKTQLSASNTSIKVQQPKIETKRITSTAETELEKPCSAPIKTVKNKTTLSIATAERDSDKEHTKSPVPEKLTKAPTQVSSIAKTSSLFANKSNTSSLYGGIAKLTTGPVPLKGILISVNPSPHQLNNGSDELLSPNSLKKKRSFASYIAEKKSPKDLNSNPIQELPELFSKVPEKDPILFSPADPTAKQQEQQLLATNKLSERDLTNLNEFVDDELERGIDEKFSSPVATTSMTKKKKKKNEDYELGISIKLLSKEVQSTQNLQRQKVLMETIQKLRKLRNQASTLSNDISPDALCGSVSEERGRTSSTNAETLIPSDKQTSLPIYVKDESFPDISDQKSHQTLPVKTMAPPVILPISITETTVPPVQATRIPPPPIQIPRPSSTLTFDQPDLVSPVNSVASNDSETTVVLETASGGRMKVKTSYLKLEAHCTRFQKVTEQHSQQIHHPSHSSILDPNRRDAPTRAYFNFPHRHSDGTYCETVCSRVLQREKMRGLPEKPPERIIEWKLIPIDFDSSHKLMDPRKFVTDPTQRTIYPLNISTSNNNLIDPRFKKMYQDSPLSPDAGDLSSNRVQSSPPNVNNRDDTLAHHPVDNSYYPPREWYAQDIGSSYRSENSQCHFPDERTRQIDEQTYIPTAHSNADICSIDAVQSLQEHSMRLIGDQSLENSYQTNIPITSSVLPEGDASIPGYSKCINVINEPMDLALSSSEFEGDPIVDDRSKTTEMFSNKFRLLQSRISSISNKSAKPKQAGTVILDHTIDKSVKDFETRGDYVMDVKKEAAPEIIRISCPKKIVGYGNGKIEHDEKPPVYQVSKKSEIATSLKETVVKNDDQSDLEIEEQKPKRSRWDSRWRDATPEKDSHLAERNFDFIRTLQQPACEEKMTSNAAVYNIVDDKESERIEVEATMNSINTNDKSNLLNVQESLNDTCGLVKSFESHFNEDLAIKNLNLKSNFPDERAPIGRDELYWQAENSSTLTNPRERFYSNDLHDFEKRRKIESACERSEDHTQYRQQIDPYYDAFYRRPTILYSQPSNVPPNQPEKTNAVSLVDMSRDMSNPIKRLQESCSHPLSQELHLNTRLQTPRQVSPLQSPSVSADLKEEFSKEIREKYIRTILNQQQQIDQKPPPPPPHPLQSFQPNLDPYFRQPTTKLSSQPIPPEPYGIGNMQLNRKTVHQVNPLPTPTSPLYSSVLHKLQDSPNYTTHHQYDYPRPVSPTASEKKMEIAELLNHVISRSLDKHIHEYFAEYPDADEKSYLLNFTQGFAAALLEKYQVTGEEMFIQLIDTATRNALETVRNMKRREAEAEETLSHSNTSDFDAELLGKPVGELVPIQVDETSLNNILSDENVGKVTKRPVDPRLSLSRRGSLDDDRPKSAEPVCKNPYKWKRVDYTVPFVEAKLPVQKNPKRKKKRRNTSRYSDESESESNGSGRFPEHVNTIDIKVQVSNKRRVYVTSKESCTPTTVKVSSRKRAMENVRPPDLTSFKLSLEDIEQLNQMKGNFKGRSDKRAPERFSGRNEKINYDITDERLKELRNLTTSPPVQQSGRKVSLPLRTTKISPDLREKIDILKKKRFKRKRVGFM